MLDLSKDIDALMKEIQVLTCLVEFIESQHTKKELNAMPFESNYRKADLRLWHLKHTLENNMSIYLEENRTVFYKSNEK